jgi:hypothetical protein
LVDVVVFDAMSRTLRVWLILEDMTTSLFAAATLAP